MSPPWFQAALREIGTREEPENRGPAIRRYIALAKCGHEGDPWCAIFTNAMLESSGVPGSGSPMARSYEHHKDFLHLLAPAIGCIVTFWRGVRSRGLGHVGFYNGEIGDYISCLGGNEGDEVKIENYRAHGTSFGLSGYYWPRSVPLPKIGKVPLLVAAVAGNGKVV